MSDFLNKLVARNLNQLDSVQPRPVSMFEPQSFDVMPDFVQSFKQDIRGKELKDNQKESDQDVAIEKMWQQSDAALPNFAPSPPYAEHPHPSNEPAIPTELQRRTGIQPNFLQEDKSLAGRYVQSTPFHSEEELSTKPEEKEDQQLKTTANGFHPKESNSNKTSESNMPDQQFLRTSSANELSLESITLRRPKKHSPDQPAKEVIKQQQKNTGNEFRQQTITEKYNQPIQRLPIRETLYESTFSPVLPLSEGREVGNGTSSRLSTIVMKGKSAYKQESPPSRLPGFPETQTKILVKPQVIQYREPTAYSPFELKESPKTSPTIQVTIGRVEVRATAPPPTPKQKRQHTKPPVMNLDEYFRQRTKGGGK